MKRSFSGSIRFRKENIDFNLEKQAVINSLPHTENNHIRHLTGTSRTGLQLIQRVGKSVVLSNLIQNFAFIKSATLKSPKNIIVAKSLGINYFRIPKAASTSMLQILVSRELGIDPSILSQRQIDVLGDLLFQYDVTNSPAGFQNLAIVRNPLSRLFSVYSSIFKGSQKDFIYQSYLFGVFKKDIGFDSFVDKLVKIPPIITDYHLKPQYDLIYDHKDVKGIKIFKMEEIDTKLNPYLKANFDFTVSRLNIGDTDTKKLDDVYSQETAGKVYKYYYRDFTYFNYIQDFKELITKMSAKSN